MNRFGRFLLTCVLACGVAISSARAEDPKAATTQPARPSPRNEEEVLRALDRRVREINFDQIELKDVIQFLRDVSGVNIWVQFSGLGAAGLSRNSPVNVCLHDVTLRQALEVILEDVGASAPLGWVIRGNTIVISTRDDLATRTVTRVYDVSDLIVPVSVFVGPAIVPEAEQRKPQIDPELVAEHRECLEELGVLEPKATRATLVNDLKDIIRSSIAPESWMDANRIGIQEFDGRLVILQTLENHREIKELLAGLRRARAGATVAMGVAVVRVSDASDAVELATKLKQAGNLQAVAALTAAGRTARE